MVPTAMRSMPEKSPGGSLKLPDCPQRPTFRASPDVLEVPRSRRASRELLPCSPALSSNLRGFLDLLGFELNKAAGKAIRDRTDRGLSRRNGLDRQTLGPRPKSPTDGRDVRFRWHSNRRS